MCYRWRARVNHSNSKFGYLFFNEIFARSCHRLTFSSHTNVRSIDFAKINQQKGSFRYFWTAFCYYWFHVCIRNQHYFYLSGNGPVCSMEAGHQFEFFPSFGHYHRDFN